MIRYLCRVFVPAALLALCACGKAPDSAGPATFEQKVERGRYLVAIAGCGECHNPGGPLRQITPESESLTGTDIGFRGPWGTSYPVNLRKKAAMFNEEAYVKTMKSRGGQPPMPWASLHAMKDEDLASLYAYLKFLGPAGDNAPDALLDPKIEPKTAYIEMMPKNLPAP